MQDGIQTAPILLSCRLTWVTNESFVGCCLKVRFIPFCLDARKVFSCASKPWKQVRDKGCSSLFWIAKRHGVKSFFLWTYPTSSRMGHMKTACIKFESTFFLHQVDRKQIYFKSLEWFTVLNFSIFDALDRNWSFVNRDLGEAWFPWNNY